METEFCRYVIWTWYPEKGWFISGSTDDWNGATESWLKARGEDGAGQSYIMEVCKLRIERISVAEAGFETIFGKADKPF